MTDDHAELVLGQVMHCRLRPVRHRFVYPVFYVRLNLAKLAACNSIWFGVDRWRALGIRTRDYGPRDGSDLEAWMRALLREHAIDANGEIWLQTFPRVAGYVFNPVSFWHCHDADKRLCAVLAEVNNTFGQTHRYLLRVPPADGAADAAAAASAAKQMYVSPFCAVRGDYRFRFRLDGARHRTEIDYHDGDGLLLRTALSGRPQPMTARALFAALLRYPLLGAGIMARIHWQAWKLWRKRVPLVARPPAPIHTTTVHEDIHR